MLHTHTRTHTHAPEETQTRSSDAAKIEADDCHLRELTAAAALHTVNASFFPSTFTSICHPYSRVLVDLYILRQYSYLDKLFAQNTNDIQENEYLGCCGRRIVILVVSRKIERTSVETGKYDVGVRTQENYEDDLIEPNKTSNRDCITLVHMQRS